MLVVVVALYVVLILLALFSDRLIFQPQPATYSDQSLSDSVVRLHEPGRLVHIVSGGERITAIYLPNSQAKYTLLFSHGNAEDLGDSLSFLQMYRDAGFAVFSYDYRGYGTSTGKPSESGVYADENAAYDYLTNQLQVPPDRIISVGRSVGCAPATHLAANRKVAGLIAEAPFMTAFRVLTRVPLLPWDKFNNVRDIKKVHVPVLIIHGRNDQVVPSWHGARVFRAANDPKRFVPIDGAGHNDVLFVAGKKYFDEIRAFASGLN
jgi:abhydrolase domain-containing protein 17